MKITRKGNLFYEGEKIDFRNLKMQQRDRIEFECSLCGKQVDVKFRSFEAWKLGIICKTCKSKITNVKKYGVENPFQAEVFKEKSKKTCMEKYGVEHAVASKEIQEKTKATNLIKFGFENPNQNKEVRDGTKKTCLIKYGVEHPMMLKEISDKAGISIMKTKFKDLKSFNFEDIEPLFNFETYEGNKIENKYKWKCKVCGTIFEDHIYAGRKPKCPTCFGLKSVQESELYFYLKKKYVNSFEVLGNKRFYKGEGDRRRNFEVDILIPEKKIGIEYDGLYWHSENRVGKKYHFDKYNFFYEKGISIINVFEDEWIEKKEIVSSIIETKLGFYKERFFARKCIIKKIEKKEEIDFLEKNHIQGFINSKICYGAFFNDKLVSLMSFGKSRFNKNFEWELLRFSNELNTTNVGIASKLYKNFIKENNPKSIISYCDLRYFSGNMYEKIGMKFDHRSAPNYYYTKRYQRFSRMTFQKHKLKKVFGNFDEKLTEAENVTANGYERIFDVGHKVFVQIF